MPKPLTESELLSLESRIGRIECSAGSDVDVVLEFTKRLLSERKEYDEKTDRLSTEVVDRDRTIRLLRVQASVLKAHAQVLAILAYMDADSGYTIADIDDRLGDVHGTLADAERALVLAGVEVLA